MNHETIGALLGAAISAALAPMFEEINKRLDKIEALADEVDYLKQRISDIDGQLVTDSYIIEELIKPRLSETAIGNAIKNYLDDNELVLSGAISRKLDDVDFSDHFDIADAVREVLNNANVRFEF